MWEENKLPILVLEVVSQTYRGEYSTKKDFYAHEFGILYYVVYNPLRKRKEPLEVYKLVDGEYVLLSGNPIWLPEIGLGIGRERGTYQGITREWLYWFDEQGKRFFTPEERIQESEEKRLQAERQRLEAEEKLLQVERQSLEAEKRRLELERQRLEAEEKARKLAEMLKSLGVDPESLS